MVAEHQRNLLSNQKHSLVFRTLLYCIKKRPQLKTQAATCCKLVLPSRLCNKSHLSQLPLRQTTANYHQIRSTSPPDPSPGYKTLVSDVGPASLESTKISSVERAIESCKGEATIQGTIGRSPSEKSGKKIYQLGYCLPSGRLVNEENIPPRISSPSGKRVKEEDWKGKTNFIFFGD
jgi:hypothetical protein